MLTTTRRPITISVDGKGIKDVISLTIKEVANNKTFVFDVIDSNKKKHIVPPFRKNKVTIKDIDLNNNTIRLVSDGLNCSFSYNQDDINILSQWFPDKFNNNSSNNNNSNKANENTKSLATMRRNTTTSQDSLHTVFNANNKQVNNKKLNFQSPINKNKLKFEVKSAVNTLDNITESNEYDIKINKDNNKSIITPVKSNAYSDHNIISPAVRMTEKRSLYDIDLGIEDTLGYTETINYKPSSKPLITSTPHIEGLPSYKKIKQATPNMLSSDFNAIASPEKQQHKPNESNTALNSKSMSKTIDLPSYDVYNKNVINAKKYSRNSLTKQLVNRSNVINNRSNISNYFSYTGNIIQSSNVSFTGMANLGNTCYMSAVMQALMSLKGFIDDLLSPLWLEIVYNVNKLDDINNIECNEEAMRSCLIQVINVAFTMKQAHGKILLDNLKSAIDNRLDSFIGHQQQDAHEFYIDLLNSIDEEFQQNIISYIKDSSNTLVKSPISHTITTSTTPMNESANTSIETVSTVDSNNNNNNINNTNDVKMINQLKDIIPTRVHFESVIRSDLTCIDCNYIRDPIYEPFLNISIDLDKDDSYSQGEDFTCINLNDLINDYFDIETRELKCSQCQHPNSKASIKKYLSKLPNVLVIHIKRFKYDRSNNTTSKINREVIFTKHLNLSTICTENILIPNNINEQLYTKPLIYLNKQTNSPKPKIDINISPIIKSNEVIDIDNDVIEDDYGWLCSHCGDTNTISSQQCITCQSVHTPKSKRNISINSNKDIKLFTDYKLCSIVRHQGASASHGHFICDRINTTSNNSSSIWERCNDSVVTRVHESEIFKDLHTPYMLFYVYQPNRETNQ